MTVFIPARAIRHGWYRMTQAGAFISHREAPDYAATGVSQLRPGTLDVLRKLPAADQWHLLAVHQTLIDEDAGEDVVLAGLLHDIGKAREGHRVRFGDRCLKVLLEAIMPDRLARFRQQSAPPRWGTGLWITCNHARLGADIARELGYNERICWLIANHEQREVQDPNLLRLQAADDSSATLPGAGQKVSSKNRASGRDQTPWVVSGEERT